ncbi:MAG TPA: GGDEF domain-containing protein [Actinomycetes bacterium]|nr:GGDEF domain-containing protein [Actinomycetes bacterium]
MGQGTGPHTGSDALTARRVVDRLLAVPELGSVALQRRAQTILIIATGMIAIAIPTAVLVAWLLPQPWVNVFLVACGFAFYALVRWLVRTARVSIAAWVLVGYFAAVPIAGALMVGRIESSPLFLVLIVVVAASVLPPKQVVFAAVIAFAELGVMFSLDNDNASIDATALLGYIAVLLLVVAAASTVLSLAIDRALTSADLARRQAERLADDLRAANAHLETRVVERTVELQEALRREQLLSAKLGELSVRDSLTGLHNRRHLDDELLRMFAYANRRDAAMSVAVVDLDNFKLINDVHTHLVGDEVLRVAARVLAANIRTSDVLVRMGGEEFALLMPGTGEDAATLVCERMRTELERWDWSSIRPDVSVTASFGVACSLGHATAADLLRAADVLLYRAKREGKNRVVCASSEVP